MPDPTKPLKMIYPSQEEYNDNLSGKLMGRKANKLFPEEYIKFYESTFPDRKYDINGLNTKDYYVDEKGGAHELFKARIDTIPTKTPTVTPIQQSIDDELRTSFIEPAITYPKDVQRFTAGNYLESQGKPSGYINMGDNTGRKEFADGGIRDGDPIKGNTTSVNNLGFLPPDYLSNIINKDLIIQENNKLASQWATNHPNNVVQRPINNDKIDYPSTDKRSSNYVGNPNWSFAAPNMTGKQRADAETYHGDIIGGELLGIGIMKGADYVGKSLKSAHTNARNFDSYVSQEDAARLRAERMLNQQDKWVGQDVNTVRKFETAVQRHNPSDPTISKGSLGKNRGNNTGISSEADLSDANKARITSHEVGHYYRNAEEEANSWNKLFDFSKEKPKTARYLRGKSGARPNPDQVTNSTSIFKMDKGSPHGDELRERAAQLKDHIAFKNNIPLNEDFTITSKQLNDALKTYISDTKLDNSMTPFIKGLKDKKGLLNQMNTRPLSIAAVGGAALQAQAKEKPTYANGGIFNLNRDNISETFDEMFVNKYK